jgi:hypothetical protein
MAGRRWELRLLIASTCPPGNPGFCEIIAASFSAMAMGFLNDPGNGWYRTSPGWPRLDDAYEVS